MLNQLPTAASDRSYKFSDDTLRDTSTKYLTGALSGLGMSDANALRFARDFTGRTDMDDIGQSLGVLDFTPAGLVYGVDEAVDQFQTAEKPIDYIAPTVGLGLSAVEAFPVTKIMTKQLRGLLKNIGNKAVSDAPVDMSKRKAMTTIAAAPLVAGALSEIPVKKITDKAIPVDNSKIIESIKKDFPNDIEELNPLKLKKYFSSSKKLFEWLDSGVMDNLMMPDAKSYLKDFDGDFLKANDKMLEEIGNLIDSIHYDKHYEATGTDFFKENITDILIEDLTKVAK